MSNLTKYETDRASELFTAVASSTDTAEGYNVPDSTKNTESKPSGVFHFDLNLKHYKAETYDFTTPFSGRRSLVRLSPTLASIEDFLPPVTVDRLKHFAETFYVPGDDAAHTKLSRTIYWYGSELMQDHEYYMSVMDKTNMELSLIAQIKHDFFVNGIATDLPGSEYELPKNPRPKVTIDSYFTLVENLMAAIASRPEVKGLQLTAKTPTLASSVPSEAT